MLAGDVRVHATVKWTSIYEYTLKNEPFLITQSVFTRRMPSPTAEGGKKGEPTFFPYSRVYKNLEPRLLVQIPAFDKF